MRNLHIFVYLHRASGCWYLDIDGTQVPTAWTAPIDWRRIERYTRAMYPQADIVVDLLSRSEAV